MTDSVFYDSTFPLLGKVIFVDPGHGGRDSGTLYGTTLEKNINLNISNKLYNTLVSKGAIVYMTRDSDEDLSSKYDIRKKRMDLYRRIKLIESKNSDLYLSIHINWYNNSYWRGAEVLYNDINPQNKVFGSILMDRFKNDLNTKRTLKKTDLYMYSNIKTTGVLIECGFLSNYNERQLLKNERYQQKIVDSITNAIIEYYNFS